MHKKDVDDSPLLSVTDEPEGSLTSTKEDKSLYSALQFPFSLLKEAYASKDSPRALAVTLCFIILSSIQNISLPLWHNNFPDPAAPYIILLFTSFFLCVSSATSSILFWYSHKKPPTPKLSKYWHIYLAMGICLAINGFILVYSSIPKRTPAILQILLLGGGFIWTLPAAFICKSKFSYCRWPPIVAVLLSFHGVTLALMPYFLRTIFTNLPILNDTPIPSNTAEKSLMWALLFLLSLAPGAIANVFFERFCFHSLWFFNLRYTKYQSNSSKKSYAYDYLFLVFSGNLIQFLLICVCFWIDIIPVFGSSSDLKHFLHSFKNSAICLFDLNSKCSNSLLIGLIFCVSFFLQGLLSIFLDALAIVFVSMGLPLSVPLSLTILHFFHAPELSGGVPLWSEVPSVLLLVCAAIIWKLWEVGEKDRIARSLAEADAFD